LKDENPVAENKNVPSEIIPNYCMYILYTMHDAKLSTKITENIA
jgi:hypothetical protein